MNEDIMSFSNELVYLYKLKGSCESEVWEGGIGGGGREGRKPKVEGKEEEEGEGGKREGEGRN
jgi:hypothetical protein